ncbi:conserved hypothetical protein [Talaromyces stipitatus ATCC 10500]|uniref:SWIM-type domain-containing protein n=1 Tax=Talaromyces stipitatus (strain ATCC 10500 / CBS 375.48 / QM 6759 / NRRL 1006) TaxID=441959 RepID=B8LZF3_TALSN|nr:uncharacterized protein TSTA_089430 [Talaromyces stipitatus ATCC 10500]EED21706.1 conserved hypothetical protein [Talaromyces stipitatus ATCC 10500]
MSPFPTRQLGRLSLGENMPTNRSQTHRSRRQRRSGLPPVSDPAPTRNSPTRNTSASRRRLSLRANRRHEGEGRWGRARRGNKNNQEQRAEADIELENEINSQGDNDSDDEEEEEESSPDTMASMILAAKSKIVYDIENLELESRARALAGLTGHFDVVYCRENSPFYEFQLIERPRIRIRDGGAECTCSEYINRPDMACRHIFWLVDQVYDSISPHNPPPGLPLSRDGVSPTLPPLHTLLQDRLESLANHLEWPFIPESERTARTSSGETIAGGLSRQEQVRDIMSAFNKVTLPEDFRKELVESSSTPTPRTPEQCVVQGDFEATIFRLAVHDDNVYSSIRKAMPAGACAAIYFDKVHQKSRNLLMQFDEYRRTGRLPSGSDRQPSLDNVSEVARELRRHVAQIRNNLLARIPYGTKGAAEALITLLQEVSARNIDAFENKSWGRVAPPGEDDDDRNLYEQLIGQSASDDDGKRGEGEGGMFILDVLEEVPASVLESYVPNLRDILAKVEIIPAPPSFLLKLKSLIHDAQSSGTQARGKRPATSEAGGSQKRTR